MPEDRAKIQFPSRRACLALPMLAVSAPALAQSAGSDFRRLRVNDTVGDLLSHPAFAGFARRMLSWDDREPDQAMRLDAMHALTPYHTHIDAVSAVAALNRLIADAEQGRQIFFDIYADEERRKDAAKAMTGLFFLRGRPGAPFAVICPGGAFTHVASLHEGFPYADEISRAGFNAFVLKYRPGQGGGIATQDLATALGYIFRNAEQLGVSTDGYSVWGSSAGARMAAAIGSHGPQHFGGPDLPKPATVVMAYTAHSDIGDKEPPTFVLVGEHDGIAPPSAMRRRVDALRRGGAVVEFREYPGVGHGFGLGIGTSAEGWIGETISFWMRNQPR